MTLADCPKCDPCCPELDEDGRPYACYFCGDTGRVPQAVADAYWQERTDEIEYVRLTPVASIGKHLVVRGDDCDSWLETRPLLPQALLVRDVRRFFDFGDDMTPPEPTALWDQQAREAEAELAWIKAGERREARASIADPLDPNAFNDDIPF